MENRIHKLIQQFDDPTEFTAAELIKIIFAASDALRQRVDDADDLAESLEDH